MPDQLSKPLSLMDLKRILENMRGYSATQAKMYLRQAVNELILYKSRDK